MSLLNSLGKSLKQASSKGGRTAAESMKAFSETASTKAAIASMKGLSQQPGTKAALYGAGALFVGQGFYHGADSKGQITNDFYDLTMGDSDIDNTTFGRAAGVGALLTTGQVGFAGVLGTQAAAGGAIGTVVGAGVGTAVGAGSMGLLAKRSFKKGHSLRGSLLTAGAVVAAGAGLTAGATTGYMAGKTAAVAPFLNATNLGDYNKYHDNLPYQYNKYYNNMPRVSGDVVFGAYNSRRA